MIKTIRKNNLLKQDSFSVFKTSYFVLCFLILFSLFEPILSNFADQIFGYENGISITDFTITLIVIVAIIFLVLFSFMYVLISKGYQLNNRTSQKVVIKSHHFIAELTQLSFLTKIAFAVIIINHKYDFYIFLSIIPIATMIAVPVEILNYLKYKYDRRLFIAVLSLFTLLIILLAIFNYSNKNIIK
ncbi:hypothetical protein [Haloplasma contractile]|uniref:Uncharacterized protein n=1 Tax=Haloplasma contractile SSD-17B TaxID=1033810 RepID=F7PV32_9MOLU|nr:hypothetical protein [Haloplasma contractile]ERJ11266.1 hypothetical protein HLPCO_002706 [Haloplasma contractile SSD-17B]